MANENQLAENNRHHGRKKLLFRKRLVALVILACCFAIGFFCALSSFDKDGFEMSVYHDSLVYKRDHYIFLVKQDSMAELNSLRLDINKFSFNIFEKGDSTISVDNATTHHCELGKYNGCWTNETSCTGGDVVAIQIIIRNSGDIPVKNISVNFSHDILTSKASVLYTAHIMVNHKVVKEGRALLHINNTKSWAMENDAWFRTTLTDSTKFNGNDLIAPKSYQVGTLNAGQFSLLVCRINVTK
jgi:hypothetical protein